MYMIVAYQMSMIVKNITLVSITGAYFSVLQVSKPSLGHRIQNHIILGYTPGHRPPFEV